MIMIDEKTKEDLLKKHYKLFNHSGVQICEWNRKSLRETGVCYKEKFYGVDCHRCMQFSPAIIICNLNCIFCWRPNEAMMKEFISEFDEPEEIVENLIELRKKLLSGFGGSVADKKKLEESFDPNHFAISLSGEPTLYPKINELIDYLIERARTVFLVTNGTRPDVLAKLKPKKNFQLYISLNAPNEEKFLQICRSTDREDWNKFNESLKIMKNFKGRRVLRLTLIRDLNFDYNLVDDYLKLIELASPDFIEVKSFMSIGNAKERLGVEFMLSFDEIKEFAEKITERSNYKLEDYKEDSRIVLLKNKDSKVVNKFD